jgi:hypothetical protein
MIANRKTQNFDGFKRVQKITFQKIHRLILTAYTPLSLSVQCRGSFWSCGVYLSHGGSVWSRELLLSHFGGIKVYSGVVEAHVGDSKAHFVVGEAHVGDYEARSGSLNILV